MASTLNDTQAISTSATAAEQTKVSDGMRIARYCVLDELPGLIFGILTVVYIIRSLNGLAP
jgi:hypothetical protein